MLLQSECLLLQLKVRPLLDFIQQCLSLCVCVCVCVHACMCGFAWAHACVYTQVRTVLTMLAHLSLQNGLQELHEPMST